MRHRLRLSRASALPDLDGITHLTLYRCEELPDLGALPPTLRSLDLDVTRLRPEWIDTLAALPALVYLRVSGWGPYEPPAPLDALHRLTRLEGLTLKQLPQACPDLSPPPALQRLTLDTVEVRQIGPLPPTLSLLHLHQTRSLEALPTLTRPEALRQLRLSWCDQIPSLAALSACTNWRPVHLVLERLQQLRALTGLEHLRTLESLSLLDLVRLEDIEALRGMVNLRALILRRCSVRELGPIGALGALEQLSLHAEGPNPVASLGQIGLANKPHLRDLRLGGLSGLRDLAGIEALPALERLRLDGLRQLNRLHGLETLPRLSQLRLRRTAIPARLEGRFEGEALADLLQRQKRWPGRDFIAREHRGDGPPDWAGDLRWFKELKICRCGWPDLTPLSAYPDLRSLRLEDMTHLRSLRGAEPLRLAVLIVARCPRLRTLTGLNKNTKLGLTLLEDLPALTSAPDLHRVDLSRGPVTMIRVPRGLALLRDHPTLNHLSFTGDVTAIADLGAPPMLRSLELDLSGSEGPILPEQLAALRAHQRLCYLRLALSAAPVDLSVLAELPLVTLQVGRSKRRPRTINGAAAIQRWTTQRPR